MTGTNTAEGAGFAADVFWNPELMDRLNKEEIWKAEGPNRVLFRTPALGGSDWEPCDALIVEEAKQFYFNGTFAASKIQNYVDMISDSSIVRVTHQTLMKLASSSSMNGIPLYEYVLSFQDETSQTYLPRAFELGVGVPHSNDVFFLFYIYGAEYWSQANLDTSKRMCAMWGNFAKDLNPTPRIGESSEVLGDLIWDDIEHAKGKILNIGEELKMEINQKLLDRMDFWTRTEDSC